LTRDDLPFEFMMNALRLNDGVPVALFEERTGLPLIVSKDALEGRVLGACWNATRPGSNRPARAALSE